MRRFFSFCGALAFFCAATSAHAVPHVDPFVITLDEHSYTSYSWPIVLSPREHLVQAPEALMSNCRRRGGAPLTLGLSRLIYSLNGNNVEALTMRIEFKPTRIVLGTLAGDVECDGAALAGETGLGRIFRDYFEQG